MRRLQETVTDPLEEDEGQPVEITGESDGFQPPPGPGREYIWGPGAVDELVCQIDASDHPYYALLDVGGNVTGIVDWTGALREQYTWDPYGELLSAERWGGGIGNRVGHKGLFYDRLDAPLAGVQLAAGSRGVFQNGSRTYAPRLGRFLQRDPNETGQGVWLRLRSMDSRGAQPVARAPDLRAHYGSGMNTFGYLGSEPLLMSDPSGLFEFSLIGILMPQSAMDVYTDYNQSAIESGMSARDAMRSVFDDYAFYQMDDALWASDWDRADDDSSHAVLMRARGGGYMERGWTHAGLADGPDARRGVLHHLATNKNFVAGKRYSRDLKKLFDRAGLSMNNKANLLEMSRSVHKGRHSGKYHQEILDRLNRAVGTRTGPTAREALIAELESGSGRTPMLSTATSDLWKFSNTGELAEQEVDRFQVSIELEFSESWLFCVGTPIKGALREVPVELLDKGEYEDMPWSGPRVFLASDRLRALLEEILPHQQEFVPTRLIRNGRTVRGFRYWAVNWLRMVDCFDRRRSEYQVIPDSAEPGGTRHRFDSLVIQRSLVPEDAHVFRVRYYETVVVARDWIRQRLRSEGITGPQFFELHQV